MRIWAAPYQLQMLDGASREGALLKVEFEPGLIGYADCHPWTQFGDPPLKQQISLLSQGIQTRLMRRSLHYAKIDADARSTNQNWFEHLPIPESRILIPKIGPIDLWIQRGFRSFKFKITPPIDPFLDPLKRLAEQGLFICLDANKRLSPAEFERLFHLFPQFLYEDPTPFDPVLWNQWQTQGAKLAADLEIEKAVGHPELAQTLVLKPAIQDPSLLNHAFQQTLIISSYLDHPVGQLCAALTAATLAPNSLCGIATHHCYHPTPYSEVLGSGPNLNPAPGKGFGYEEFLEKEHWEVEIFP